MPPRRVRMIGRLLANVAVYAPWLWGLIRGPVKRFWDRMAAMWDANESPNRTQSLRAAIDAVGQPQRILEIGTGTGSGAAILKARFPDADVTGVDLSPEMVRIAQAKVPGVTFEPADASRLPFADGSFDLVAQNNVPVYFDELARVLAPRGRVLIASTFGPATPYYTPHNVLRRRFAKLGFEDLRSEQSPPGDWFLATKG
ncbi:MAG TPA: class I SAM-dependent methyltransferase [Thermoleophilaceae bacterium]|nr:class I SAM-dependent methyltransferase [Thermoleophilaceae bacterium]